MPLTPVVAPCKLTPFEAHIHKIVAANKISEGFNSRVIPGSCSILFRLGEDVVEIAYTTLGNITWDSEIRNISPYYLSSIWIQVSINTVLTIKHSTLEFACTFLVLFLGITVAFDKKRSKDLGLPMVALVISGAFALAVFMSITVTGQPGYAGAGLNPARCLGPTLLIGGPLWNGHWVFWVGPFLACILYYGVSLNLPKEGLVWEEGEFGVFKLAGSCFKQHYYSSP